MSPVYTIGVLPTLRYNDFLYIMKAKRVTHIIDIRPDKHMEAYTDFSHKSLISSLPQHNLTYLPFNYLPTPSLCNKYGKPLYSKIIKDTAFLLEITKLKEHQAQGNIICLLGRESVPQKCFRSQILGKYLATQSLEILHLLPNGELISQDELESAETAGKNQNKARHHDAISLGNTGEQLAEQYLKSHGYTILDRNWNLHKGCEIDIVAFKNDIIHFVEVKTRTAQTPNLETSNMPLEAIDNNKIQNIKKAIHHYIQTNYIHGIPFQTDSVSIIYDTPQNYKLEFHEKIYIKK